MLRHANATYLTTTNLNSYPLTS